MRNWIEIDGVRSTQMGLKIARLPLWPFAMETAEAIAVPAVPTAVMQRTGNYENIEMDITAYLTRWPSPDELARIQTWLMSGKKLVFSTQPDMYAVIQKVGQITPARIGTRANEIVIPLTIQPFKYAVQNASQAFTTSSFTVLNRGNIFAEPVYKLTFDSDAILDFFDVNGERLTIQSAPLAGKEVYIDIPRRVIYTEDNGTLTVVQRYTVGRFWAQVLEVGWNTFGITEDILSVEVTKNERWL